MSDKWKAWNQKKPKDSKYNTGGWEGSPSDYEKAEQGATKPGMLDSLKEFFGGKKKKDEEEEE